MLVHVASRVPNAFLLSHNPSPWLQTFHDVFQSTAQRTAPRRKCDRVGESLFNHDSGRKTVTAQWMKTLKNWISMKNGHRFFGSTEGARTEAPETQMVTSSKRRT